MAGENIIPGQAGATVNIGAAKPEPNWAQKYGLTNFLDAAIVASQENFKQQQALNLQAAKDKADMERTMALVDAYYKPGAETAGRVVDADLIKQYSTEINAATTLAEKKVINDRWRPILASMKVPINIPEAAAPVKTGVEKAVNRFTGIAGDVSKKVVPWLTGNQQGELGKTGGGVLNAIGPAMQQFGMGAGIPMAAGQAAMNYGQQAGQQAPPGAAAGAMGMAGGLPPVAGSALARILSQMAPPPTQGNTVNDTISDMMQKALMAIMGNQQQQQKSI